MRTLILLLLLALPISSVFAQTPPTGTWTTIDDATGQPKSVIEVYEAADGTLAGRVDQVLQSTRGPDPLCEKCRGARRNKPIKGMIVLWNMRRKGDAWEGGQILDPASGKIYSATLRPIEGGEKLEVRGFVGFSLLGRTQEWVRN
ncbi:MAG: DUF2147 domain-containing protein [Pseudomonadota bacterium]|nr:DUF2147 domain-containing protein [Pseudomonadota bacterium]